jgi:hypothetical protein
LLGSENKEWYTAFHVAAAAKKPNVVEALAETGPTIVACSHGGKHFDQIGSAVERTAIRAAFARGFAKHLAGLMPQSEKPVSDAEEVALVHEVVAYIDRHHDKRPLRLNIDPGIMMASIRRRGSMN